MLASPRSKAVIWIVAASLLGLRSAAAQEAPASRLHSPSADVPPEWLTKAERTEFRETPRYAETIAFSKRLASASEWIDYRAFGTSPEGRELPLLVASTDGTFAPDAVRASGKYVVMIQNCIHAGECAGKDASLMLLRDIAVTKTRAGLLENCVLVVLPVFSVDGHERFSPYSRMNQNGPDAMGWRVTSRNLNLNRDYMKADATEMRAWLRLFNAWQPHFFFDNHTTDGGDWQYDVTYAAETHGVAAPQVAAWLNDALMPRLARDLTADGHVPMIFFDLVDSKDPTKGIRSGGFGPRYSTGYATIRNRAAMLVETHMLKPYRTRVISNYNIMLHVIETLNRDKGTLRKAIVDADADTIRAGKSFDPGRRLPVAVTRTDESDPITFKGFAYKRELSEVSGTVRISYDNTNPIDIETTWSHGTKVSKEVTPPLAYIIPPQWTEVIDLIRDHGLRTTTLAEPTTLDVESFRFTDVSFPSRPYESRFQARVTSEPIKEQRTFPAGSVLVPLDQPGAKVAVHLLEPDAPDSLLSWGFFNAIFEQKEYGEHYVLEALARQMLAADLELRDEFVQKVRTDRAFASNARARLHFFYQRSPYWDDRKDVYPVGRVTSPIEGKLAP